MSGTEAQPASADAQPAVREYLALLRAAAAGAAEPGDTERLARLEAVLQRELGGVTGTGARISGADALAAKPVDPAAVLDMMHGACALARGFTLNAHQRAVARLMAPGMPQTGLLLFHGVGTGKTCTAISVAEQFREVYSKRTLLVGPKRLRHQYMRQVFDVRKLVDGVYMGCVPLPPGLATTVIDASTREPAADRRTLSELQAYMDASTRARYEFMGYRELANALDALRRDQSPAFPDRVAREFSDRLIVVDEAHNMRGGLRTLLHDVLRYARNVRLVMMTATPMYDDAVEVLHLLNNFLINDGQEPLPRDALFRRRRRGARSGTPPSSGAGLEDYSAAPDPVASDGDWAVGGSTMEAGAELTRHGEAVLRELSARYVSYVGGDSLYSFPVRLEPSVDPPERARLLRPEHTHGARLRLREYYASPLSPPQRRAYDRLEQDVNGTRDVQAMLQVCNVVFAASPQSAAAHGEEGYNRVFQFDDDAGRIRYRRGDSGFYCLAPEHLARYAPKLDAALSLVDSAEGVSFLYTKFIYSGLLPAITALEHRGYRLLGLGRAVTELPPGSPPPNGQHFVVLSNLGLSRNAARQVAALTAPANADGSRVRVVLGSRVAVEGYDLAFIRAVHVLDPWFNMSLVEQVVGRAARHCSHRHLPLEKRNVTVYLHVATHPARDTEDVRAYDITEHKHAQIARVERVLKEHAVDCAVNRDAFTFPLAAVDTTLRLVTSQGHVVPAHPLGDRDGSLACDLRPCRYACRTAPAPSADQGNSAHSSAPPADVVADVHRYMAVVMRVFRREDTVFQLGDLRQRVAEYFPALEVPVLYEALRRLVEEQVPVRSPRGERGRVVWVGNAFVFRSHRGSQAARLEPAGAAWVPLRPAPRPAAPPPAAPAWSLREEAADVLALAARYMRGRPDPATVLAYILENRLPGAPALLDCVARAYAHGSSGQKEAAALRAALVATGLVLGEHAPPRRGRSIAVFDYFGRRVVAVPLEGAPAPADMREAGMALLRDAVRRARPGILAKDGVALGLQTVVAGRPQFKLRLSRAKGSVAQRVRAGTACDIFPGPVETLQRELYARVASDPTLGGSAAVAPNFRPDGTIAPLEEGGPKLSRRDQCVLINLWLRHVRAKGGVSLVLSHLESALYPHALGLRDTPGIVWGGVSP